MSDTARNPAADLQPGLVAIVLAAGRSSRMAPHDKLLRERDGIPVLRQVVSTLTACIGDVRVVVRGHSGSIRAALLGLPVHVIENAAADEGMASSIRAGIASLASSHRGALIMLGDMPCVTVDHLHRLIDTFAAADGQRTVVPVFAGRRGNPVLWSARYFDELRALQGDAGARGLLQRDTAALVRVEMPDDGVLIDIDTAEDWQAWLDRT